VMTMEIVLPLPLGHGGVMRWGRASPGRGHDF
jgi:hypothetical protein